MLLAVLPCLSPGQNPTSGEQKDFRIALDVEQVVLTVVVRDRGGELVPNLDQRSFRVYEDGKPQQINFFSRDDIPVTAGLVIDNSRSMRPKWMDVITASMVFARTSNPQDDIFVVSFNENASLGLEGLQGAGSFTANPHSLRAALIKRPPDGQTALYDALALSLQQAQEGRWDKQVLLVVSDGGDNASKLALERLLEHVERSPVILYTVGVYDALNRDRDPGVLKKLARLSGGSSFFPKQAKEVVNICEEVAREIRNHYAIGYKPANQSRDGSFRKIVVTAKSPEGKKLEVRTRPGYLAPEER